MTAMFLLFIASTEVTDLHRELLRRTFDRFLTIHERVRQFIAAKILFSVVLLMLCFLVMFGGGSLIFCFYWQQPWELVPLAARFFRS